MTDKQNEALQTLCRKYLSKLKSVAAKHGLRGWVEDVIERNKRGECSSTEEEVELLARAVEEDRISRDEVPKVLGKSYRKSYGDRDFDRVKKFDKVGIYSRVSAILLRNT